MHTKMIMVLFSAILLIQCSKKTTPSSIHLSTPVDLSSDKTWRKTVPPPGPARPIELSDFQHYTMENGLTVIVAENHKIPRVSYDIILKNDPVLERDKKGYTAMAGQLLTAGTEKRKKAELDEAIDFIGASITSQSTGISASSLTKHQDTLLSIMTEMLFTPSFPEDEFNKMKRQSLSALATVHTNPEIIATHLSKVLNFGKNHPYGEIETEATIQNIDLEDCKNFYHLFFAPNNAYLVITGDITLSEAQQITSKYFKEWKKKEKPEVIIEAPKPVETTKVSFGHRDAAVQSLIRITYPIDLKPGDDEVFAAQLANTILGGGTFLGRLLQNLREDKGYTYVARSSLQTDPLTGSFSAYANVRNSVTDSALVEFLYEMEKMVNEPVSEEDLQLAKNTLAGSFARSLESPQNLARYALNTLKFNLPKDYYATYLQKLEKVSIRDVQVAASRYIRPTQANIIVIGDESEVAEKLIPFDLRGKIDFYDAFANPVVREMFDKSQNISARKVIQKYLEVIGGNEVLMNIKSMVRESSLNFMGQSAQMKMYQKSPGMYAMNLQMQGMTIQDERFNRTKGYSSMMGNIQTFTEGHQFDALKRASLIIPQLYYPSDAMEIRGIEKIGDQKVYRLAITLENNKVTEEFYNYESGLLLRSIEMQEGMGGIPVLITTELSDYREVNGVKIPFKMTISGATPQPIILETTTVEINTEIPDEIFYID
ncbi:MAG TPA: insulinase family protein [Saprospiraceae bacterium]|nr:insulinase family protein [Saprospiraceae bacterium]